MEFASEEYAYAQIPTPARSPKPRTTGLTMVVDKGLGLAAIEDLCAAAGEYIDLWKVGWTIPAFQKRRFVAAKVALCRQQGLRVFPGGMFLELALLQDKVTAYLAETRALGFDALEISDNVVIMPLEVKVRLIDLAVEKYGFTVLAEVGKKPASTSAAAAIAAINRCLAAGAWKVLLEAMELFRGEAQTALIDAITAEIDPAHLCFELPLLEYHGTHRYDQQALEEWLVTRFGPEVNIGNVDPDHVLTLETLRRGLWLSTMFKVGHYQGLLRPAAGIGPDQRPRENPSAPA